MRNIRLVVAYDGTEFHGWQRQPGIPTIQGTLETAIERITKERVRVWGSGRTDAGVHASNQVANFKTQCRIPCENLMRALNRLLPPAIRAKEAVEVSEDFHARYDVHSKTYRYRILQSPVCSPFVGRFVYHFPFPLDQPRMAKAAKVLEGRHDFTSFAGAAGDEGARSPNETESSPGSEREGHGEIVREIFSSRMHWRARTLMLIYEVKGSGFLHHMVRNIVGTLIEIGRGKLAPEDIQRILEGRDRGLAGPTAPAQGLCLVRVEY